MKNKFIIAEIEIIEFDNSDVITTSVEQDDDFGIELPEIELDW